MTCCRLNRRCCVTSRLPGLNSMRALIRSTLSTILLAFGTTLDKKRCDDDSDDGIDEYDVGQLCPHFAGVFGNVDFFRGVGVYPVVLERSLSLCSPFSAV